MVRPGPGDQLALGWVCDADAVVAWSFGRNGRDNFESYRCHPFVLAQCCAIRDETHYLYELAFPMCGGKWYPEQSRLRRFEDALLRCTQLAEWAFLAAGNELETLRTDNHALPSWIHLTDPRVPQQPSGPPAMPSPLFKPYPGTVAAAEQARQDALQDEFTACQFRAAKEAALQRALDDNAAAALRLHQVQQAHTEQTAAHRSTRKAGAAALRDAQDHLAGTQAVHQAEARALQMAAQRVDDATAARVETDSNLARQRRDEERKLREKQADKTK